MGINVTDETLQEWVRKGLVKESDISSARIPPEASETAPPTVKPRKTRKKDLVPTCFVPPATWLVGIETKSEANLRVTRSEISRKASTKKKICQVLGQHLRILVPFSEEFQAGRPIRVKITRLGGRKLDQGNLWRALKAAEDAVALMLGADDGSSLWQCAVDQEANERIGLKIELWLPGDTNDPTGNARDDARSDATADRGVLEARPPRKSP